MFIEGANNPGNKVNVNSEGRIESHSIVISEQSQMAIAGDAYNLNTGNFTLTDDAETALFFIKNDSEEKDLIITRIFVAFGVSTGGSTNSIEGIIMANPPTGGIIASGVENPPQNFNFGSSKVLQITSKTGTTALGDVTGGNEPVRFFFTGDNQRHLVGFEAIVLPRGASMAFSLVPPTGNTSMVIQAGANIYLASDV